MYLYGILSTFPDFILIAKDKWFVASKGGLSDDISYSKQPADHMSDFSLYFDSFIYSGDLIFIYYTYNMVYQHEFMQIQNPRS